ncbi:biliverdin-producing heme oxygenase [Allohahella marinimesophila]|uniref:Heme oxygenase n=1 Tax=Allohahella marinimesophila TaxID=1054972 RepID=A0ABP7P803_9GAMM
MSDPHQALALETCSLSLAAELKRATDTVHLRLHQHPLLVQLHQTTLTRSGYCQVLNAFYEFYSLWEPRYSSSTPAFSYQAMPLKWLAQDFAVLDRPCPLPAWRQDTDRSPGGLSEMIGYLYVKQGSTLGGQHISRHVQRQLGLTPGESQFFFHGFGDRTGLYWKVFQRFLNEVDLSGELDIDAAKASALSAFESLEAILNGKIKGKQ